MKTLNNLNNVSDNVFFVRADFNVPIVHGKVVDDFRIKKAFKTIDYLISKGAKIIISSHIESKEGTLLPIFEYLKDLYPVVFVSDYYPEFPDSIPKALDSGNIVLLENLRKYKEEKDNDETFSKYLANFADYYVNEAFPASHREHASIVGIPKFIPCFAGFVFENEVVELTKALNPQKPSLAIIGGAKFSTKSPVINRLLSIYDNVFVGGALANDFLKKKGMPVEASLVSDTDLDSIDLILENPKLLLPIDEVIALPNDPVSKSRVGLLDGQLPYEAIYDSGPETLNMLSKFTAEAKTILWNGPLGNYENGFSEGTKKLALLISQSEAESFVGGGDTIASIKELDIADDFTFISTGGGAMLDFLTNKTLPGITALE